jgi:hypothetical protein
MSERRLPGGIVVVQTGPNSVLNVGNNNTIVIGPRGHASPSGPAPQASSEPGAERASTTVGEATSPAASTPSVPVTDLRMTTGVSEEVLAQQALLVIDIGRGRIWYDGALISSDAEREHVQGLYLRYLYALASKAQSLMSVPDLDDQLKALRLSAQTGRSREGPPSTTHIKSKILAPCRKKLSDDPARRAKLESLMTNRDGQLRLEVDPKNILLIDEQGKASRGLKLGDRPPARTP